MHLTYRDVSLSQLLLDPNNYRLDYGDSEQEVPESQIPDRQRDTRDKLEKERLSDLRESIIQNGFLEVDRIVVRPYEGESKQDLFVVVEGNRRTAALQGLIEDYKSGLITLTPQLIEKAGSISVVVIQAPPDERKQVATALMGIRHVSGPKKWTGYQSAKLIAELYRSGKSLTDIGALLGISSKDAGRRFRGYHAWKQMREDPVFGSRTETYHYALLLEFLTPHGAGRNWLRWSESKFLFESETARRRLYAAIIPAKEGERAEIGNPSDARAFQRALHEPVLRQLIEQGKPLHDLPKPPRDTEDRVPDLTWMCQFLTERWSPNPAEVELLREIISNATELVDAGVSA